MLLMIDNYDSFTYNVVQYLGELGADVHVVRNDEIAVADIAGLAPEIAIHNAVFNPGFDIGRQFVIHEPTSHIREHAVFIGDPCRSRSEK